LILPSTAEQLNAEEVPAFLEAQMFFRFFRCQGNDYAKKTSGLYQVILKRFYSTAETYWPIKHRSPQPAWCREESENVP
jgi:hypothetical protein